MMSKETKPSTGGFVGLGKRLFLVDGAGALVSAVLLGGLLASYPQVVGMPRDVLLLLAGLAAVFAVYSFSCFFLTGTRWRPFLRVIGVVNIAYCLLTLGLMYADSGTLRLIGALYFTVEILVVLLLANIELKAANTRPENIESNRSVRPNPKHL